jgi:hypothetical protein
VVSVPLDKDTQAALQALAAAAVVVVVVVVAVE